jgi:hypothetical protein
VRNEENLAAFLLLIITGSFLIPYFVLLAVEGILVFYRYLNA